MDEEALVGLTEAGEQGGGGGELIQEMVTLLGRGMDSVVVMSKARIRMCRRQQILIRRREDAAAVDPGLREVKAAHLGVEARRMPASSNLSGVPDAHSRGRPAWPGRWP